jgi:hypothetical protein
MEEIWTISEGAYDISNKGNVRRDGYILKKRMDRDGYEIITLTIDGCYYTRKVHRLVGIAFIPNPENKPQINHIDGNKLNNTVNNLEWCTAKENIEHSSKLGLQPRGEEKAFAKLTEENVSEIKQMVLDGYGNSFIGNLFGVTCGAIYSIRINSTWTQVPWPAEYRLVTAWRETKGGLAKLNAGVVSEIKQKLREGYSIKDLQNIYGMSGGALRCIRNGSTWKEVN